MPILRQQSTLQVTIGFYEGQSRMTAKEMQENIQRMHVLEQNIQQFQAQKQQFQAQLFEIEGALKELSTSPTAYKIVGGIMIATEKGTLQQELSSKKEMLELRIQAIERQEKQTKEKTKKMQEEFLAKK